ncbi:MAG: hypothetical protein H0W86_05830 [Armatimonadetes bacterium]|nr:hypothetical protein [Armatimonadota bacterium]
MQKGDAESRKRGKKVRPMGEPRPKDQIKLESEEHCSADRSVVGPYHVDMPEPRD